MIWSNKYLFYLLACGVVLQVQAVSDIGAEELTAEVILKRSAEAMKPPIRYRSISRGVSSIVCQKPLADGTVATRLDVSSPVPKISLILDDSMCEFYPDRGIGIDTTFMRQSMLVQAAAFSERLDGKPPITSQVKTVVLDGGRECFEVTSTLAPSLSTAVQNSLPQVMKNRAKAIIPREAVAVIDTKTFQLVETRAVSQAGSTISQSEFSEIEQSVDLSEDLFLPPDGIELLKPQSIHEYVRMLRHVLALSPDQLAASREIPQTRNLATAELDRAWPYEIGSRNDSIMPAQSKIKPPQLTRKGPTGALGISASEVLRRTKEAMSGTMRYKVIRDGVETLVYQLAFSDGTTAIRAECTKPEQKVLFAVDKVSCEFFPSRGVGIDTSFVERSFIEKRLKEEIGMTSWNLDSNSSRGTQVKSNLLADGRESFEISAPLDAMHNLYENSVPRELRVVVDGKTYEVIEARTITRTGTTVSRTEFRAVERLADIPDDLFLPPSIDFLQPRGIQEYLRILREMFSRTSHEFGTLQDAVRVHRGPPWKEPGSMVSPKSIDQVSHVNQPSSPIGRGGQLPGRTASRMREARATAAEAQAARNDGNNARLKMPMAKAWLVGILAVISITVVSALINRRFVKPTASPLPRRRRSVRR
jgi:hypothetical protein